MANNYMTEAGIEAARKEAAICAEGTPLTADDLYSLWADACVADDYAYDPRPLYEDALRRLRSRNTPPLADG